MNRFSFILKKVESGDWMWEVFKRRGAKMDKVKDNIALNGLTLAKEDLVGYAKHVGANDVVWKGKYKGFFETKKEI